MYLGSSYYDPEFHAKSVHRERLQAILDTDPPAPIATLARIKYRKGARLDPKTQAASKNLGRASVKLQPVARRFLARRRIDKIRNAS